MSQLLICLMFVTDIGGEMLKATLKVILFKYAKAYRIN